MVSPGIPGATIRSDGEVENNSTSCLDFCTVIDDDDHPAVGLVCISQ